MPLLDNNNMHHIMTFFHTSHDPQIQIKYEFLELISRKPPCYFTNTGLFCFYDSLQVEKCLGYV